MTDPWLKHQQQRFMRPDAHRFMRPDANRYLRPDWRRGQKEPERKYDPDQPRVPAGNPDGGQWSNGGIGSGVEGGDDPIFDFAQEIVAAGASASYQECLDRCVPLLERFRLPGSDRNQWDFIRCMNICLGRNR